MYSENHFCWELISQMLTCQVDIYVLNIQLLFPDSLYDLRPYHEKDSSAYFLLLIISSKVLHHFNNLLGFFPINYKALSITFIRPFYASHVLCDFANLGLS